MTSKELKKLSPKQWKAIAWAVYGRAAERRGVKICKRHFDRLTNGGFIRDLALEHHFGFFETLKPRSYKNLLSHSFWWYYADAIQGLMAQDFILGKLIGDKDLAPTVFKMRQPQEPLAFLKS